MTLPAMNCRSDSICFEAIDASIKMMDVQYVRDKDWNTLYSIPEHPMFDILRTPDVSKRLLEEINDRRISVGDTLRTADLFYIWKPYFEWLSYIDPHYYINMTVPSASAKVNMSTEEAVHRKKQLITEATILPVRVININDTLIVSASVAPELCPGDVILAINDVPVSEIMKYNFRTRHEGLYTILNYRYFHGVDRSYSVGYLRNGHSSQTVIEGYTGMYSQARSLLSMEKGETVRIYQEENTGYVRIADFYQDNKAMVKRLVRSLKKFKEQGLKNVIIDLRDNPGGMGNYLTEFFSIFIKDGPIMLSKSEKLKVSELTVKDYSFLSDDDLGKLVDIPEKYMISKIEPKRKYYIGDLCCYILMDEGTASTAAFVCNVLQYNGGAVLAGEPLLHNAYVFGDVTGSRKLVALVDGLLNEDGISTSMSDLYTKAVDGVLMPDIHIPYVAKDYMTGKDAMLDKLLKIISGKSNVIGGIRKAFKDQEI